MNNQEIVAKLWNLCNVLRDDGITYQQTASMGKDGYEVLYDGTLWMDFYHLLLYLLRGTQL